MIIDAYATDTTPSHEVRRRALEALANEGEPMSEVTYDALRKRLAQAETEIQNLRAALRDITIQPEGDEESAQAIACAVLGEKK